MEPADAVPAEPESDLPALVIAAGLALGQVDREHPPHFAEEGAYGFRDAFPVTQVTSDALVFARDEEGSTPSYVGVLREARVEPWRSRLRFGRYEHFSRPVGAVEEGQPMLPDGFCGAGYDLVAHRELTRVLRAVGKLPHSRHMAWAFAQTLHDFLIRAPDVAARARAALLDAAPLAHVFHRAVHQELLRFLQARGLDAKHYRIDTKGLIQDGTTRARYSVLGGHAQPHMAVMEPFRCAVDFVGQSDPASGVEARTAALAALGHVTSGQYDAAVVVFIFQENALCNSRDHLSLGHVGSRNFLEHLEAQRVLLTLVDTTVPS
jgi:hypothetical protein